MDILCFTDSKLLKENNLVRIKEIQNKFLCDNFLISINGNFAYRLLTLKEVGGIYLLNFIGYQKSKYHNLKQKSPNRAN